MPVCHPGTHTPIPRAIQHSCLHSITASASQGGVGVGGAWISHLQSPEAASAVSPSFKAPACPPGVCSPSTQPSLLSTAHHSAGKQLCSV